MRKLRFQLRCVVGESLVETGTYIQGIGELIRDLGGFVLPDYERHPAFSSNSEIDAQVERYTVPAQP